MAAERKIVATNRKARHDYFIEESYEAGIVLVGTELKAVRSGGVNLRDGFVQIRQGEAWLLEVHITAHPQTGIWAHEPKRARKLLLHRREIDRLEHDAQERGYTIVPLQMYLVGKRVKVEIAIVRGKRLYDKRHTIAERDEDRRLRREWKEFEKS